MSHHFGWLWDPSRHEYCFWEPQWYRYVYQSEARNYAHNSGSDSQQKLGSPRTPQPPPASLAEGSASFSTLAGSPTQASTQEYIYRQRYLASSSSTGSNTQAAVHPSVPIQQPWPTLSTLAYGDEQHSAEAPQVDALTAAFASTSLDQGLDRQNSSYARAASGPSQHSYESSTSQTGSVPGLAPNQEAALPSLTCGPVRNTPGGKDGQLNRHFKLRRGKFFKRGRVFKVYWHEPGGHDSERTAPPVPGFYTQGTSRGWTQDPRFGERIYSKIRWFIVVRSGSKSCICVPINTYGSQGVGKPGLNKNEHAIAYTGGRVPQPHSQEIPLRGEDGLRTPIRIQPDEPGDKLESMSRIDYSRTYTVEHNVKAMAFGFVHTESEELFFYDFRDVFFGEEDESDSDDDDDDDDDEGNDNNNKPPSGDEQDQEEADDSDRTRVPNKPSSRGKNRASTSYTNRAGSSSSRSAAQTTYEQNQLSAPTPHRQHSAMSPVSEQRYQSTQQALGQAQAQAQIRLQVQQQGQQLQETGHPEPEMQQQTYQVFPPRGQRGRALTGAHKSRGYGSSRKTKR